MQKLQTTLQRCNANLPTQLEMLQVIHRRGTDFFKEEKQLYKSIQAGDDGERKLLQYLLAFGLPHWVVLRNLWLKDFKIFECDPLLLTRHCIYIFEIKHYRGTFSYSEGKCFFNGIESPLNPFEQVRANAVSVRNYLKRQQINIPLKAAVIFTGEDNEVFIQSDIQEIEAVQSNGIRNFIGRLISEEKQSSHHTFTPEALIQALEQIETANPFMPQPLSAPSLREIKGGIHCANCLSFNYQRSKTKIHCECGYTESIEQAALRAIYDYATLHYNRSISRVELLDFLEGGIGLSLLRKILSKYFDKVPNRGHAYYDISPRKIEHLIKEMTIEK